MLTTKDPEQVAKPAHGSEEEGIVSSPGAGSDSSQVSASSPPAQQSQTQPPLPSEAPPTQDDGWDPVWDGASQAYYFYNRFTGVTQWENPRVPEASAAVPAAAPGQDLSHDTAVEPSSNPPKRPHGGYDPAIHGSYDPTAPYALEAARQEEEAAAAAAGAIPGATPDGSMAPDYGATGAFNRFTGKWQAADINPENHNDENKSKRQMNAFFDVDAAANRHQGRSLKAERSGKKLSRQELKAFREKRKEKKEEKRRAWLRD